MDSLVYVSFGDGRHVDEVRFSVLSAARYLDGAADWRIVLYTDRTDPFAGLPVELRLVDGMRAASWAGRHRYVYRSKIMALGDSLAAPDSRRSAIVDGDTYFKRSPATLFSRLSPGRTLMHVREGRPAPPEAAALRRVLGAHRPTDLSGSSWGLAEDERLWNSGVVGLHEADRRLCDEAAHLTDQLLDHGFGEFSHTAEMVALGACLERRSTVGECFDVVAHYWPTEMRRPFHALMARAWDDQTLGRQERFDLLWPQRPREGTQRRVRFYAKRIARRAGLAF